MNNRNKLFKQLLISKATEIKLTVKRQSLSANDMDCLIEFLNNHPKITELKLNNCEISPEVFYKLIIFLSKHEQLRELNLNFTYIKEVSEVLIDSLQAHPNLRKLSLNATDIDAAGFNAIARMLEHNKVLTSLSLAVLPDLKSNFSVLVKALEVNSTLERLKLVSNKINSSMAILLFQALTNNKNSQLKMLYLQSNSINNEAASAIGHMLATNSKLKKLHLGLNPIDTDGIIIIASGLLLNQSLTYLNLQGIDLRDQGLIQIAESLRNHPSLQKLGVNGCNITDIEFAYLIDVLKDRPLTTLRIGNNTISQQLIRNLMLLNKVANLDITGIYRNKERGLGDDGIKELFDGVTSENCLLKGLILQGHHITHEGINFMVPFLSNNKQLKVLHLNHNKINTEGAIILAECLVNNETLQELHLSQNCIDNPSPLAFLFGKIEVGFFSQYSKHDDNPIKKELKVLESYCPHKRTLAAREYVLAPVASLVSHCVFAVKNMLKENPSLEQAFVEKKNQEVQSQIARKPNFTFKW